MNTVQIIAIVVVALALIGFGTKLISGALLVAVTTLLIEHKTRERESRRWDRPARIALNGYLTTVDATTQSIRIQVEGHADAVTSRRGDQRQSGLSPAAAAILDADPMWFGTFSESIETHAQATFSVFASTRVRPPRWDLACERAVSARMAQDGPVSRPDVLELERLGEWSGTTARTC